VSVLVSEQPEQSPYSAGLNSQLVSVLVAQRRPEKPPYSACLNSQLVSVLVSQ
jgi:hypothetical protein